MHPLSRCLTAKAEEAVGEAAPDKGMRQRDQPRGAEPERWRVASPANAEAAAGDKPFRDVALARAGGDRVIRAKRQRPARRPATAD